MRHIPRGGAEFLIFSCCQRVEQWKWMTSVRSNWSNHVGTKFKSIGLLGCLSGIHYCTSTWPLSLIRNGSSCRDLLLNFQNFFRSIPAGVENPLLRKSKASLFFLLGYMWKLLLFLLFWFLNSFSFVCYFNFPCSPLFFNCLKWTTSILTYEINIILYKKI